MAQQNNSDDHIIDTIFDRIEAQGIRTDQKLLYSYFFYDKDSARLASFSKKMIVSGYTLINQEKYNDEYKLQLDKVEVHDRQSLFNRGLQLSKLAAEQGINSYDGFEVGNADPSKLLISREQFLAYIQSLDKKELYKAALRLYDLKIIENAAIAFKECIRQRVCPDTSSLKLGNILLLGEQKPEEAVAQYEAAINFNANYTDAYYRIGAVCYDLAQYTKSEEYYRKALAIDPKDDRLWYGVAADQYAVGDYAHSLENCRKALELNAQDENAQTLMTMLENRK